MYERKLNQHPDTSQCNHEALTAVVQVKVALRPIDHEVLLHTLITT